MKKSIQSVITAVVMLTLVGCQSLWSSSSVPSSSMSSSSTSSGTSSYISIPTSLDHNVESVYYDISNDYTTIYDNINPSVAVVFVYNTSNSVVDQGSGFVFRSSGTTKYLLTNYGVARAAQSSTAIALNQLRYELLFGNNVRVAATLVGYYGTYDVAVLQFNDTTNAVPVAPLGVFDGKQRGEEVLVIGTPKVNAELRNTLTRGVISGLERMISDTTAGTSYPAFQIDAPTNTGVFGGPVIDNNGLIIGVVQYRYLDVDSISESISFAIGINDLEEILDQIITSSSKTYTKVRIGITVQDIRMMDLATRSAAGIPAGVTSGLYVVESGVLTPAYVAGIRAGDIVTTADGFPVSSLSGLSSYLYRKAVGETFVLQLHGKGSVNVVLTAA